MSTTAFLTDATLCIGCKACEVACKEWNDVPADGFQWSGLSYDNTEALGASTWRHVMFLEQPVVAGPQIAETNTPFRWTFLSDVCKHCANSGCLEGCPTGSIVRTELGGIYVQPDVCNGCGYCVVSCPFGVIDKRPTDGRAFKCTFCYDRQKVGLKPACATACPTTSIQFGLLSELAPRAEARVVELKERGYTDAQVYNPTGTTVGGINAISVILGEPENYNLPPAPEVPTAYLKSAWTSALISATVLFGAICAAFALQ
ncbi:MAG TPA: 4Fe-4S dicluster domain-containing protein [Myxococcales bacterium]|jgi:formate dehydrogenase iron-sulfur subunit|nr:4Fe-4S dicluster domain-containing protein [Myxococcales bacterium]